MDRTGKHFSRRFPMAVFWVLVLLAAAPGRAETVRRTGEFYDVRVTTGRAGGKEVATVRVTGRAGYHCNTLYRWKLSIDPAPGVPPDKRLMENRDAARFGEGEVVFRFGYARSAGQAIAATLKFSVCNAKQCVMETVALRW